MLISNSDIDKIREITGYLEHLYAKVDDLYSIYWAPSVNDALKEYCEVINTIYLRYDNGEDLLSPVLLLLKDAATRLRFISYESKLKKHKIEEMIEEAIDYLNEVLKEFNLFLPEKEEDDVLDNIRNIDGFGIIRFYKDKANKSDVVNLSIIERINDMVKRDKIEEAIDYVLNYTGDKEYLAEANKDFLLISGRFQNWKTNDARGIKNDTIKHQIAKNFLDLVTDLGKKIDKMKKDKEKI